MTEEEQLLATQMYEAIQRASNRSPRSEQAAQFVLGVSNLGFCSERTRRLIAEIPEPETDKLAAFIGTAVGDHAEQAWVAMYPEARIQETVHLRLTGDSGSYVVYGHPDILMPWGVIDVKTSDGVEVARRSGPDQQQRFQRHLYCKAAWELGMFGDVPLEELRTANIWIDRSGADHELVVEMDHYSEDVVDEATRWLDNVVYAFLHDEQVMKEPPRELCRVACGHFEDCRGMDSDVTGLITDTKQLTAIGMYLEGLELERQGDRLKKQAKPELLGVSGNTGTYAVRWIHVNEQQVKAGTRNAYERLNITKMKK